MLVVSVYVVCTDKIRETHEKGAEKDRRDMICKK